MTHAANKMLVLVVGAGASKELGLPTGAELRSQIANLLRYPTEAGRRISGDEKVRHAIEQAVRQINDHKNRTLDKYIAAARLVSDAMPLAISIDNFLDAHQENSAIELCGKLAIIHAILSAERQSILYFERSSHRSPMDFARSDSTWLNAFLRLLTENCTLDNLPDRLKGIAIIVFNYDRCIEHFLYHAFQTYYAASSDQAAALVKTIDIFHPYGTVGHLPWQNSGDYVAFGEDAPPRKLLKLCERIKTFTEGTDPDSSDIATIQSHTTTAERLLFLGFAFHKLNLNLLFEDRASNPSAANQKSLYGTATGISAADCSEIVWELSNMTRISEQQISLRPDLKCKDIFSEYSRLLSLANHQR